MNNNKYSYTTIKVGDRVKEFDSGYNPFGDSYYGREWYRVQGEIVKKLSGVPGGGVLTLLGGRAIPWHKDLWVTETAGERKKFREETAKRRKNKTFQKELIAKHFRDLHSDLVYKKRRIEELLNQIPLDKRLPFFSSLTDEQRKIYEFFEELKDSGL